MKILAIGDPHGKLPKNLNKIVKDNKPDVIVCVGDVPPVPKGYRKNKLGKDFSPAFAKKADTLAEKITHKLCSFGLPVLMLQGNMYLSPKNMKFIRNLFGKYKNLFHKKTGKFKIKKQNFILVDIFWEKHSVRTKRTLKRVMANPSRERRLNKMLKELKDVVIVSHSPPYGVLDKARSGKHVGSKILLKAIKKNKPELVLCGHVHESKGKKKIGKTTIYNLGCCGDYEILRI